MSDSEPDFDDPRFLVEATPSTHEQSYADKRKRKMMESELKGRTKSRKQREEEQRQLGLEHNLLDHAQRAGGDNKALKMMQAMGFKPGDSLGKPGGGGGGFAKASFTPSSPSTSTPPTTTKTTEPIKFQIRTGRTGLGIPQRQTPTFLPQSSNNDDDDGPLSSSSRIDSTPLPSLSAFLSHIRQTLDSKRAYGILKSCRRTLEELDRRQGRNEPGQENVMWFDPDEEERELAQFKNKRLFDKLDREIDDHSSDDDDDAEEEGRKARIGQQGDDEVRSAREKRRDKSELDYLRGKSDTVVETEDERTEREQREEEQEAQARANERKERKLKEGAKMEEKEEWFALDVSTRLALTMSYLRHHYHYCFYCGCQYTDAKDLEENCPGTEEEDH